jgi:hypothetical protein
MNALALAGKLARSGGGQPQLAESWSLKAQEFESEAGVTRDAIRRRERTQHTEP